MSIPLGDDFRCLALLVGSNCFIAIFSFLGGGVFGQWRVKVEAKRRLSEGGFADSLPLMAEDDSIYIRPMTPAEVANMRQFYRRIYRKI